MKNRESGGRGGGGGGVGEPGNQLQKGGGEVPWVGGGAAVPVRRGPPPPHQEEAHDGNREQGQGVRSQEADDTGRRDREQEGDLREAVRHGAVCEILALPCRQDRSVRDLETRLRRR